MASRDMPGCRLPAAAASNRCRSPANHSIREQQCDEKSTDPTACTIFFRSAHFCSEWVSTFWESVLCVGPAI